MLKLHHPLYSSLSDSTVAINSDGGGPGEVELRWRLQASGDHSFLIHHPSFLWLWLFGWRSDLGSRFFPAHLWKTTCFIILILFIFLLFFSFKLCGNPHARIHSNFVCVIYLCTCRLKSQAFEGTESNKKEYDEVSHIHMLCWIFWHLISDFYL